MNDEKLEQHLRSLSAPQLPESWRAEILATGLREARPPTLARETWPAILLCFRRVIVRNPITAGALTALWLLIFLFKSTTPVDPSEKDFLAHYDPNRPVYLVTLQDEILLARLLDDPSEQRAIPRMP